MQYAYAGRFEQALNLSRRAIASAVHSGAKETAAGYQSKWAVIEALIGNFAQAQRDADAALRLAEDRDTKSGAALALAMAGEDARAQQLAEGLENEFPDDTAVRFYFVPTIRAVLALARGHPEHALDELQAAMPYELGGMGALYPVYVRGEAYLAARRPAEAVVEFQKIIDLPGVLRGDPVGALARLQLARAYDQQGSRDQARAAYQDFLALWREATPGIPILAAAKSEYARLK
jgi:predicted Zn-dependent protease